MKAPNPPKRLKSGFFLLLKRMAKKKEKEILVPMKFSVAKQKYEPDLERLKEIGYELAEKPEEKTDAEPKAAELKAVKPKVVVAGVLAGERVLTESSDDAREFYNQSRFGSLADNGKVELSLLEALYLLEKGRLVVKSDTGKELSLEMYLKKARKSEPNFWIRYCVFKDMRNRGYIIKTALKFGADFRVYERGVKPGEDHAKWVVFPVHEGSTLTWHDFSAKNRVAHSTKKRLLIGVVDDENDVTYYEIRWMRP